MNDRTRSSSSVVVQEMRPWQRARLTPKLTRVKASPRSSLLCNDVQVMRREVCRARDSGWECVETSPEALISALAV